MLKMSILKGFERLFLSKNKYLIFDLISFILIGMSFVAIFFEKLFFIKICTQLFDNQLFISLFTLPYEKKIKTLLTKNLLFSFKCP